MNTLNIQTISPKDILRKEAFRRAIPSERLAIAGTNTRVGDANALHDPDYDPIMYEILTQSDFLREYDVNSHKINSMRYYPNPIAKDDEGKYYAKVKTRVAVAYQRRIHTKRTTALTGNNANIRLIEGSQESLETFRKGWELKNMETAIHGEISADGKVGDAAVCHYISNGKYGWRLFSYETGDTLYPLYDPMTGKLAVFGRRYVVTDEEGKPTVYLDVWDERYYIRYRQPREDEKPVAIDGWVIDSPMERHGFPFLPISYDRYGEPFWAASQRGIEGQENALSQLAENNMAYALRILYSFGEEMDMQSTVDGTPLRIDSPDPNARVGFLEPADASNSFSLQLKENNKNIYADSFTVETPEIKSGSDMSSLTVKMLFADAYLKALDDAAHFQPFIDSMVECFQYGYFLEIGRPSEANTFKVKAELFPYIFQSEAEAINGIVQLKGIGALSRQSASEMAYEYGFGVVGEDGRIKQEEHDALVGEQQTSERDTNVVANSRRG
jgi:hypothetical protein